MTFKQPGPWFFALGMTSLGFAALSLPWFADPAPPPGVWMIPPICLIAASLGLFFLRIRTTAAGGLALYWLAWLFLRDLPGLIAEPAAFPHWVSAAQAVTFATVAVAFARGDLWRIARVALGLTIALFGAIHALHPGIVTGLLPEWFPVPGIWPYMTGILQIVLGLLVLTGFRAHIAAFIVGLMWLSWIPLVHLPRLIGAPGELFEWTFMLTALALAGAAWSVGERIAAKSGEDFQPSVR